MSTFHRLSDLLIRYRRFRARVTLRYNNDSIRRRMNTRLRNFPKKFQISAFCSRTLEIKSFSFKADKESIAPGGR